MKVKLIDSVKCLNVLGGDLCKQGESGDELNWNKYVEDRRSSAS